MSDSAADGLILPRLTSALGLAVMLACGWLLSSNRRRISLRVIGGGVLLQFTLALIILRTTPGYRVFQAAGDFVTLMLNFVNAGSVFVFGPYGDSFAFAVLPTIIFVSAVMSILYHFGIMQALVRGLAWVMQKTFNTSGAETLSCAANVFVGQTEAPLVVRPYLDTMTRSELMAVMVGGFATIAGGVMAAYVRMGIDPVHLLSASVISAPAALMMAKLLEPEVDHPQTLGTVRLKMDVDTVNFLDAAAQGTADGLKLALNVGAMLIAFLALLAMVNYGLDRLSDQINGLLARIGDVPFVVDLSLDNLLGWAFSPFAWLLGIPREDCFSIGELLGLRMAANEFIAYQRLSEWTSPDSPAALRRALDPRSQMLVTYALCGFANLSSIGIQVGGIGTLCPSRRSDLARLGFRAMLGGMLACFMTACVAGIVY